MPHTAQVGVAVAKSAKVNEEPVDKAINWLAAKIVNKLRVFMIEFYPAKRHWQEYEITSQIYKPRIACQSQTPSLTVLCLFSQSPGPNLRGCDC